MVTVTVKVKDATEVDVYQNESAVVKIVAQIVRLGVTVDDELSMESTNPVQNKVITAEIKKLESEIAKGGGAAEISWDDIKDRPFYDTRIRSYYSQAENPNPVSFSNTMLNMSLYKVSDLIPTREEIFGSTQLFINGNEYFLREIDIQLETDDFVFLSVDGFGFLFANKEGTLHFNYPVGGSLYPMSVDVPKAGIYYQRGLNAGVPEGRTIEFFCGGELKQIDPKFIPKIDALPEVSESNNGDFLCVENGKWAVKSLSEWSGGIY